MKLLDGATGNGRSAAYFEAKDDCEVKVEFSGTIGGASIALETSPDSGSTFIPSGATFSSSDSTPVMVKLARGERLYANMTGASGTTAHVWVPGRNS